MSLLHWSDRSYWTTIVNGKQVRQNRTKQERSVHLPLSSSLFLFHCLGAEAPCQSQRERLHRHHNRPFAHFLSSYKDTFIGTTHRRTASLVSGGIHIHPKDLEFDNDSRSNTPLSASLFLCSRQNGQRVVWFRRSAVRQRSLLCPTSSKYCQCSCGSGWALSYTSGTVPIAG